MGKGNADRAFAISEPAAIGAELILPVEKEVGLRRQFIEFERKAQLFARFGEGNRLLTDGGRIGSSALLLYGGEFHANRLLLIQGVCV